MPPPPAPVRWEESFHTLCVGGGPRAVGLVPPTPVTYGWLPGSSTASALVPQSLEPSSPAAAKIDCPSVAACSNSVFSSPVMVEPVSDSHSPHEVETTLTALLSTIAV